MPRPGISGREDILELLSTIGSHCVGSDELQAIDAYWRACNYLAVGMIYLRANPLLREPLQEAHIKHRLLGQIFVEEGLLTEEQVDEILETMNQRIMYMISVGR